MKLDWMMLANHAEVSNGLLYISGGTWDTINVQAPPPPQLAAMAPNAVAVAQGSLVIRLLFHVTETGRNHGFALTVMDEDGGEVGSIAGEMPVERRPDVPPGWDHGVNLSIPITGLPLARFGLYTISLQVDGQHVGDLPFRVVKQYA